MELLQIQKMEINDCSFLNKLRNECVDFLHDSRTFTVEQTLEWFSTLKTPYFIILQDNEKVGYIRTSDYSAECKSMYIGCDIIPDRRKQGIAYRALSILIPSLEINKLYAEILSFNQASLNLYLKLGFSIEIIKKDAVLKNGKYVDSIITSKIL
jgi:RimJ/RimL family protein N-acetyltransferase